MQPRTLAFAFLTLVTISVTTVSAQPATATPGAVEPRLAFGGATGLALRSNGDVLTWGDNVGGGAMNCLLGRRAPGSSTIDPTPVVIMHNAKQIAAGGTLNFVLTNDGKVYGWGAAMPMAGTYFPCDGPTLVPSLAGKVVARIGVSPGFTHADDVAVAVTETGDIYCFGNGIACLSKNEAFAHSFTRIDFPEVQGNVLDIRVGEKHTLVLTKDHKLYAFGHSRWGQLGDSRFTLNDLGRGTTHEPVLTNVVSFAAGIWNSVAVKDDGTVWTWGYNRDFELCDGTKAMRRVPTQLTTLTEPVVQVAATGLSSLFLTKSGALYGCGNPIFTRIGLDVPPVVTGNADAQLVPRPTRVPLPAATTLSAHPILVMAGNASAFSPDGCRVFIASHNAGVRGASAQPPERFVLRNGLSLCATSLQVPVPDVDPGALHKVAPASAGVDCWVPNIEERPKDAKTAQRYAQVSEAMRAVERLIRENTAFGPHVPEAVRMHIFSSIGNGALQISGSAYARQIGPDAEWTPDGCGVKGIRKIPALGAIAVYFNSGLGAPAASFSIANMKPSRFVSGLPVYRVPGWRGTSIDTVVITRDGRMPVVPVTLADRLDQEASFLAKRLDEARAALAQKPQASVEAITRENQAEVLRQVDALRAYRASFSADELRAPWVQADESGPEQRELAARIAALEALSPDDQREVNDIRARVRALQTQARTRGTAPGEVTRLRQEEAKLLERGRDITAAHHKGVAAQLAALQNDVRLRRIRPGDASQAAQFKDDPTFYDGTNPGQIRLITVVFDSDYSRQTTPAQARAWMDTVMNTFDYAALTALVR